MVVVSNPISWRLIRIQTIICTRMLILEFLGIPRAFGMFQIPFFFFFDCGVSSSSNSVPAVLKFLEDSRNSSNSFHDPRAPPRFLKLSRISLSLPSGSVKFHKVLGIPRNSSKLKKKKKRRRSIANNHGSR